MRLTYNHETLSLQSTPLDVGYNAGAVHITPRNGTPIGLGGCTQAPTLIITLPFWLPHYEGELESLARVLHHIDPTLKAYVVLDSIEMLTLPTLPLPFILASDSQGELGDAYGVRIGSGSLNNALAKTLLLLSKDGALYYEEILKDLDHAFNEAYFARALASAIRCYNGEGCHA